MTPGDPNAMMRAVAQQPVTVPINAGAGAFFFYKSGIIDSGCSASVNHAVTIVGYGTDSKLGKDYWLIKNSYGPNWGENGYLRVLRTNQRSPGVCGILTELNAYPTMK